MAKTEWVWGREMAVELGALSPRHLLMWVTNWNIKHPEREIPRKRGWYGREELIAAWNAPREGRGAPRGVRRPRKTAQK